MENNQQRSSNSSSPPPQHHHELIPEQRRHIMFMEPNPSKAHFDQDYKNTQSTHITAKSGAGNSSTSRKADGNKVNSNNEGETTSRVSRWRLQLNTLPSSCFILHPHNFGFRSIKPLLTSTTEQQHNDEPLALSITAMAHPLLSFSSSHSETSETSSLELVAVAGDKESRCSSSSDDGPTVSKRLGGVSCNVTTCTVTSTGSGSVSTDNQGELDATTNGNNNGRVGMALDANHQHLGATTATANTTPNSTSNTTAAGCMANQAVSKLLLLECSAQGNLRIGVSQWKRGYYDESLRALKQSAVAYKLLLNRDIFRGRNKDTGCFDPQYIKVELVKVYLSMGRVYSSLGRYRKCKKYYMEALSIMEYEHHQVAGSIITTTYTWNGRIELECDHRTKLVTAQVLLALGETYEILEPAAALVYFQDAISIQKEIAMGPAAHHVDVGASLMSFGLYLEKMEDYSLALGCYEEARKIYQEQYTSADEATALASIGWVRFLLGDLEGALSAYDESLQIRRSVLGCYHHSVASLLLKQGAVYVELGQLKESLSVFKNALTIQRNCFGEFHEDIAVTLCLSGDAFGRLRGWETAKTFVKQAIQIRAQLMGDNHMLVAESCLQLGQICQSSGDRAAAASCFKDVLQIYRSNRIPLTDRRMVEVQIQLVEAKKRATERFVLRHCLSMQLR